MEEILCLMMLSRIIHVLPLMITFMCACTLNSQCTLYFSDNADLVIICQEQEKVSYKFNTGGGIKFTTYGIAQFKVENGEYILGEDEAELSQIEYHESNEKYSTISIKCENRDTLCSECFEIEIVYPNKEKVRFLTRDSSNRFLIPIGLLDQKSSLSIVIHGLGFMYPLELKNSESSNVIINLKTDYYIPNEIDRLQFKTYKDTLYVNSEYTNWRAFYKSSEVFSYNDLYNYMDCGNED